MSALLDGDREKARRQLNATKGKKLSALRRDSAGPDTRKHTDGLMSPALTRKYPVHGSRTPAQLTEPPTKGVMSASQRPHSVNDHVLSSQCVVDCTSSMVSVVPEGLTRVQSDASPAQEQMPEGSPSPCQRLPWGTRDTGWPRRVMGGHLG